MEGGNWMNPFQGAVGNAGAGNAPLDINENEPGNYENILNDPINNNVDVNMFNNNNVDVNMFNNVDVNMFNNVNNNVDVNMFNNVNAVPPAPYRRDPELLVPAANINRIMRRILPSHAKVSEESKELLQDCTSEFIGFVTAEANERCRREQRKTVSAEDILFALSRLGFENYVGPLTTYLNRYRHSDVPQNMVRGDPSVRRTTYFPGAAVQPALALPPPPPPPPTPLPVAHPYHPMLHNFVNAGPGYYPGQQFFDPAAAMNPYNYYQNAMLASSSNAGDDEEPADEPNQPSCSSLPPPPPPPPTM